MEAQTWTLTLLHFSSMSIALMPATLRDIGFVFSLVQNGANHGHFDDRIIDDKPAYRAYLESAITRREDPSGYSTEVFLVVNGAQRVGAAVITAAVGTPDAGVEIALIALKREHRGHGFGAVVLERLLNAYWHKGSVYVRCLPASHMLHEMLLRRGFSVVGASGAAAILWHPSVNILARETDLSLAG